MSKRFRVILRTANIRSNPRQFMFWVHRRMKQAMNSRAAFVGGQEIEPSRRPKGRHRGHTYASLWRAVARQYGKVAVGADTEVPLAVPSLGWKTHRWDVLDVHNGLARVTPDRDILRWYGEHRVSHFKHAVFNCHPVSRGHYTDAQARRKGISHIDERQAMLKDYFGTLKRLTKEAIEDGYCVSIIGDLNDPTPAQVHPDQVRRGSGLDHGIFIPAPGYGVSVQMRTVAKRTRQMDHPILEFDVTYVKR